MQVPCKSQGRRLLMGGIVQQQQHRTLALLARIGTCHHATHCLRAGGAVVTGDPVRQHADRNFAHAPSAQTARSIASPTRTQVAGQVFATGSDLFGKSRQPSVSLGLQSRFAAHHQKVIGAAQE